MANQDTVGTKISCTETKIRHCGVRLWSSDNSYMLLLQHSRGVPRIFALCLEHIKHE